MASTELRNRGYFSIYRTANPATEYREYYQYTRPSKRFSPNYIPVVFGERWGEN